MEKKLIGRLLLLACIGLLTGGAVFLCASIWGEHETTLPLCGALGCILLSNLFLIIRQSLGKGE